MGNKLCKKKVDAVDTTDNSKSSTTPFDRIITRLHLRPNAWKSDSHLNQKQANRYSVNKKQPVDSSHVSQLQPLSKSSDWTTVDLEAPEQEEKVHLRNPKLSLIFNNSDNTPPQPPPRKHKPGFREKIEAVAKTGLQAFQSKSSKPVEEPLFVKKKINYKCPLCDSDEVDHNRDYHHHHNTPKKNPPAKGDKRRKNLSIVSLPNYNELKLTVATFDDIDKPVSVHNSNVSLPTEAKKLSTASTGKLDTYITRCRSFGSLLPQQLLDKLRARKVPADVESDDSFGGLEDWDVGLIEHYDPRDATLPRQHRKLPKDDKAVLSNIEDMIVKDEEVAEKPKPPVRRSESLVKKLNREASETASKRTSNNAENARSTMKSVTPPPSPVAAAREPAPPKLADLPTEENGQVEHSSLMKILEQFSIQDAANGGLVEETFPYIDKSDENSTNISCNKSIQDFIRAEKVFSSKDLSVPV